MIKMSRGQAPQTVGRVCSSQGLAMVEKNKGSVSLQSKFLRDSVNNRLFQKICTINITQNVQDLGPKTTEMISHRAREMTD